MKITLLCLVLSISIQAQGTFTKTMDALSLNSSRELKIHLPNGYQKDSLRKYPLTIILDADDLFDIYVSNATLLAKNDKAPGQIIIGINQHKNKDRYRDCSYEEHNSHPIPSAQRFLDYIRSELVSFAIENYRVSNFRTIVGNTLTANFINYFLIENQPSFDAFIALNPTFAPDMPFAIQDKVKRLKKTPVLYYLSNGSYNSNKKNTLIKATDERLKNIENPNFKFSSDYFNQDSKIASIGQSLAISQAFIFQSYGAISTKEYRNHVAQLSPPEAIAYLEKKYNDLDYLFDTDLKIRERDIYAIEGIILDQENGDYLKEFGQMIQRLYPESPLGDYYIGNFYETGGKLKKALKYYKNGYSKVKGSEADATGYYQNITRILKKQKGSISQ
ncbi:MAG: hypothetical protein JKY08_00235 [Flavobacteriaceae bacterium]|nr:hypothetical protein [Flavobacteriaceae bacterium]